MPDEVCIAVLAELPDISTLMTAMLVSKQFSRCAASACSTIITREIGVLSSDALAALQSAKLKSTFQTPGSPSNRAAIAAFSRKYIAKRAEIPITMSLQDARHLARLEKCVSYFARRFEKAAYRMLYKETVALAGKPIPAQPTISTAERTRFRRMFYLFETYCNLYKEPRYIRWSLRHRRDQSENFFDHLAPWEKEQFASVVEFLAFDVVEPRKSSGVPPPLPPPRKPVHVF